MSETQAQVIVVEDEPLINQAVTDRLRAEGLRGEVTVLEGEYAGSLDPPAPRCASASSTIWPRRCSR